MFCTLILENKTGKTATDQRPDRKKLETVFGTYSTSLSLREAMEKEVVAKANTEVDINSFEDKYGD